MCANVSNIALILMKPDNSTVHEKLSEVQL